MLLQAFGMMQRVYGETYIRLEMGFWFHAILDIMPRFYKLLQRPLSVLMSAQCQSIVVGISLLTDKPIKA